MVATRWLTFPLLLTLLGCASWPSPPPMTANRVFAGLIKAASWTNAEEVTIVLAGQQYLASRRYHDGYAYFYARAGGAGARPIYLAFEGLFQAEMARGGAASAENVAAGTVKTHVRVISTKLGAKSRTEAVNIAIQRGLLR